MPDKDFVVKNGLRTVGNSFVANSSQVTLSTNLAIGTSGLSVNSTYGTAGQVLTTNGSSAYWSTLVGVNTDFRYVFSNTITFSGNVVISNTVNANGGIGTSGQVLTSAGSGANVFWSTLVGVNTSAQYVFANTITFSNTITIANISANGTTGTAGQVLASDGTSTYWYTIPGGSVPGGSNTFVQFNDSTAFGGVSGFTFNKSTNTLAIGTGGSVTIGTATINSTAFTGSANTANNASFLGAVAAASYVQNTDSRALSGNLTFTGLAVFTNAVGANGNYGVSNATVKQALLSGGSSSANAYWGNVVTSIGVSGLLTIDSNATSPTLTLNAASQYTFTNTITLSGGLTVSGGTLNTANANISSQTLTPGATISWNVLNGQVATVTLNSNAAFSNPTNLKIGTYILHVIQDTTGGRKATWGSAFKWTAATAPALTSAANARDVFSFVSDGTNLYGSFLPDVR